MSKYIDADKISSELQKMIDDLPSSFPLLDRETLVEMGRGIQMARQFILNCADTADVKEVKHGKWLKPSEFSNPICSNCSKPPKMLFGMLPDYCPWCGADMTEK